MRHTTQGSQLPRADNAHQRAVYRHETCGPLPCILGYDGFGHAPLGSKTHVTFAPLARWTSLMKVPLLPMRRPTNMSGICIVVSLTLVDVDVL